MRVRACSKAPVDIFLPQIIDVKKKESSSKRKGIKYETNSKAPDAVESAAPTSAPDVTGSAARLNAAFLFADLRM